MPTRIVLLAALAVLALAAALATPRAAAEEPADAEAASTVTTLLRPGWNMAAWLGEDAPVQALFDAVPQIEYAMAWDAEAQRERRARPRSILRDGLERLTTGMGLWLRVGGDAPVEWTREAAPGSVLLELREGRNRVGWTGRDGVPAAEALSRFGDNLVAASRWNAETQRHERYRLGAAEDANTLRALRHGAAIEVELTSDARWWQSGTAPPVTFAGDVPEEEQARIRGWVDAARAVYAERWGIEAPVEFIVGSSREALAPDYLKLRGKLIDFVCADHDGVVVADYGDGVAFALTNCLSERTVRHEYFHALQDALSELSISTVQWLAEGTAEYAELIDGAEVPDLGLRLERERDRSVSALTRRIAVPSLESLESREAFRENRDTGYRLGFLAAQRLVDRSSEAAILDFYRSLTATADWREAFEAAFGIAPDAFYADFEAYLARVAPPLPHLTDDRDGPALVFAGDVPDETQAAVRAEFDRVRAFFTSRFGTPEPEFTIYAGPDASSLAATHLRTFGMEIEDGFHGRAAGDGAVSIITLDGAASPPHNLDWHYHFHVRANLAPWGALPDAPEGYDRRGPLWLVRGVQEFVKAAYRASADIETYENAHSRHVSRASRTKRLLGGVVTQADLDAMGAGQNALGFLAAERLAERAGEPALFEYYRLLPASADWREAFEAAFGIAPDAFYADFEAYRARVAPPLPHLTDDRDGPVLVFLGDVPADSQEAVLAEMERVRAFFTERFGTPEPDFTAYLGPDAASLAATHLRAFGREITSGFCNWSDSNSMVSVITMTCGASPLHHLDWHYHFHVRSHLAPSGSLPDAPEGYDRRGPVWLWRGVGEYVKASYRSAAGIEPHGAARVRHISSASRAAQSLGVLETQADADAAGSRTARALGFLAAERLVALAGEPALFEYYAALPDAAGWREAFERAFGVAPDAFYADFEAYRARVAPPADGAP